MSSHGNVSLDFNLKQKKKEANTTERKDLKKNQKSTNDFVDKEFEEKKPCLRLYVFIDSFLF